jgi:hypothetical protein
MLHSPRYPLDPLHYPHPSSCALAVVRTCEMVCLLRFHSLVFTITLLRFSYHTVLILTDYHWDRYLSLRHMLRLRAEDP